jgi:flagellar M-ring protein FliF
MRNVLKKITGFFQNVEKKRLILIVALASVVVIAGIVGAVLLNQVHYTVLFSGLDASEAGKIKTVLDGMSIQTKVEGTDTILVPEDKADDLRIELASQGYPSTGLNYSIFTGSSALGSTDLERRTMLQYQLQENIRMTIRHMEKVQDCIVIANLASDSSFVVSDNQTAASVAVELNLKNGETLSNTEAKTIQQFVLKCVPDLKPENVSIVDSKMNYYDLSEEGNSSDTEYSATQQQLTEEMKEVLSKQALNVLEPAVGKGNVAVAVNLTLDFDKQTVSKVEFAAPVEGETSGLVRSSQETINNSTSDAGVSGVAGTNTNGTGTPAYVAASPSPSGSTENNATKTFNYELNEVRTQIEKAQGALQNLSVAVLVNSNVKDVAGYADNYKNLVAKAIGVKPDYISVEIMPFAAQDAVSGDLDQYQQSLKDLSQSKLIRTIITAATVLAAVIVVARFFLRKPTPRTQIGEKAIVGAGEGSGQPVGISPAEPGGEEPEHGIELTDLVLKKSSEAEKIEELMDRYPETVAQILRTWLAEDN